MDDPSTIIVVGASAGGVDAIRTVVAALPVDLDAAVFVTLHIGAHRSDLPWLLGRVSDLPATHPKDGEPILSGHIYVAPPDHHMLVEAGLIRLTKGPRENWARPAIDPLFRTAAAAYGENVIGVILTGGLNDGTAGLIEVKAKGGTAIVQDPCDANSADMPRSALANVEVDHVLAPAEIGPLLANLVAARRPLLTQSAESSGQALSQEADMDAEFTLDKPVAVTCPDCGGALRRSELGPLTQFKCHIGHVYTAEVVVAAQFIAVERFIEQAMRSLSERAELCRIMAEKPSAVRAMEGDRGLWDLAGREALEQTAPLRELLTREWIQPGSVALSGTSGS